ncbi:unnamed protein product [Adineta ricciae]|uniref:Uncharacterized protein n=1 Tax=Adineta ricciae TaxID=249248 RepID=A0A814EHC5_ADIRI|nr:unnamed protein product [Adineta ricciae]
MVEVIQTFSSPSKLFTSNIYRKDNKQVTLPIIVTTIDGPSSHGRVKNLQDTTRWIGRSAGDTLPQLDSCHAAYTIHRKTIYHELSQFYPAATADTNSTLIKIKQQYKQKNGNKDSLNVTVGTTTTTVAPLPNVSSGDTQNTRLFNTLSKHVTIKAEPIRQTNFLVNNTKKVLSSWQKYWTSTYTQRRRRESNESEVTLHRPKLDRGPLLAATNFPSGQPTPSDINVIEDSIPQAKSPSISNYSTFSRVLSPQVSESESLIIKKENSPPLPTIVSSAVSNLPTESLAKMDLFKLSEEKTFTPVQSKYSTTENNKPTTVKTKVYKLPLPSNITQNNKTLITRKPKSKQIEAFAASSIAKTKESASTNRSQQTTATTVIKTKHPLSTVMTTTSRSKYERINWEEPYVGVRFDPPTPPCSPSLFLWPEDSDHGGHEKKATRKET